jgi:cbb3-type cytochrome oxidase subunit 3
MIKYAKAWATALLFLVVYCAITTAIEGHEARTERCSVIRCT